MDRIKGVVFYSLDGSQLIGGQMLLLHVNCLRSIWPLAVTIISAGALSNQRAWAEDCNNNGVEDATDIADGKSVDCQPDGVPDECQLSFRWPPVISDAVSVDPTKWHHYESGADLASDRKGVLVAVWTKDEDKYDEDDHRVLGAYSLDSGLTWSPSRVFGYGGGARVARDSQGIWVVAWSASGLFAGTGNDSEIFFSRSLNGRSWSAAAPLNSDATSDAVSDRSVSIAVDQDGNWIAVWLSNGAITLSKSSDGIQWGERTAVHSYSSGSLAEVATDGVDTWVMLWSDRVDISGNGTDSDILFSRSTDDGNQWSSPAPLNATMLNDTASDTLPGMATDGHGNWVAVWTNSGFDGVDNDILCSRSNSNAASWTASSIVSQPALVNPTSDDKSSHIATDGNGAWVVVWNGGGDVLSAYSSNLGADWSLPHPVNAWAKTDTSADAEPVILWGGLNRWPVAWQTNHVSIDPYDRDIVSSRISFPYDSDCNHNKTLDECEIANTLGADCNQNSVLDICIDAERDCNENLSPDECDIILGASDDCSGNGVPDECGPDCNNNGTADDCDILGGVLDGNDNDVPDECESATLIGIFPMANTSLWRFGKNRIRLSFDLPVNVPPPGAIQIRELLPNGAYGEDVSAGFTFVATGKDLIIHENGQVLKRRKWYEVSTKNWPEVGSFSIDYVVQPGDASQDRQVGFTDLSVVNPRIPTRAADMTEALSRYDVNADGIISFSDIAAVNSFIPSILVYKPSGH